MPDGGPKWSDGAIRFSRFHTWDLDASDNSPFCDVNRPVIESCYVAIPVGPTMNRAIQRAQQTDVISMDRLMSMMNQPKKEIIDGVVTHL